MLRLTGCLTSDGSLSSQDSPRKIGCLIGDKVSTGQDC